MQASGQENCCLVIPQKITIQSEPAADWFGSLHLPVQLQEQPLKTICGTLTPDDCPQLKTHAREVGAQLQQACRLYLKVFANTHLM